MNIFGKRKRKKIYEGIANEARTKRKEIEVAMWDELDITPSKDYRSRSEIINKYLPNLLHYDIILDDALYELKK